MLPLLLVRTLLSELTHGSGFLEGIWRDFGLLLEVPKPLFCDRPGIDEQRFVLLTLLTQLIRILSQLLH